MSYISNLRYAKINYIHIKSAKNFEKAFRNRLQAEKVILHSYVVYVVCSSNVESYTGPCLFLELKMEPNNTQWSAPPSNGARLRRIVRVTWPTHVMWFITVRPHFGGTSSHYLNFYFYTETPTLAGQLKTSFRRVKDKIRPIRTVLRPMQIIF